jgi:virginiamycin A acetyltransferase
MDIIKKIFITLYKIDNSFIRKRLLTSIAKSEGGQPYSATIRIIYGQYHKIEIGMYSYGGCFSLENVPAGTKIGRYCSFARKFTILNGNHPTKFKSLHPFFFNPVFGHVKELLITRSMLIIENDVWVGNSAIILPSVTRIGNGAIIGAGCIVTENVPPYAIVVGNPGKVIKYRFDEKMINKIQESKWWERDIKEIKADEQEFKTFTRAFE